MMVGRLVPADAHVLALAPVLRVPLPLGIPVHPLQRVLDAVRRVDPLLVGDLIGRQAGPLSGVLYLMPSLFSSYWPELFFGVPLGVVMRPDANDLAVLHVDRGDLATLRERALGESLEHGLVLDPQIAFAFLRGPHRGPPLETLPPDSNVAGGRFLRPLGLCLTLVSLKADFKSLS